MNQMYLSECIRCGILPCADPGVLIRILAGCTTGAMAVSFAQPTDVVKVRFQAQMNLSGVARRYNGTMQAYKQIYQLEGFRGLWKGATPPPQHLSPHAAPLLNIKSTSFDWVSLTPSLPHRDSAQHHEKRAGELHGAGDVRPDQRGHPEAQPPVW